MSNNRGRSGRLPKLGMSQTVFPRTAVSAVKLTILCQKTNFRKEFFPFKIKHFDDVKIKQMIPTKCALKKKEIEQDGR